MAIQRDCRRTKEAQSFLLFSFFSSHYFSFLFPQVCNPLSSQSQQPSLSSQFLQLRQVCFFLFFFFCNYRLLMCLNGWSFFVYDCPNMFFLLSFLLISFLFFFFRSAILSHLNLSSPLSPHGFFNYIRYVFFYFYFFCYK